MASVHDVATDVHVGTSKETESMPNRVAAVVLAAGRGTRAGGGAPKQYRDVQGAPVLRHALALFAGHPDIDMVQPVIHRDDAVPFARAAGGLALRLAVHGGETRQDSVRAGLSRRALVKSSSLSAFGLAVLTGKPDTAELTKLAEQWKKSATGTAVDKPN